jgi:hypothetical protein
MNALASAAVKLIDSGGRVLTDAAVGSGPVDAVYKVINRIIGVPNKLTEFTVKSVTEGIDAVGEVLIRIESEGITYTGRGADTDIIMASAKAYMNALNRLLAAKGRGEEVAVRYFIKLIGWKDHPMPLSGSWYQLMVNRHMAHATETDLVKSVSCGDKFVLYCIKNRFTDIQGGGFIGVQTVTSKVYRDRDNLPKFGSPWVYINDVKLDFLVPSDKLLRLRDVKSWDNKSGLLTKALKEKLQWLPLREISRSDYEHLEKDLRQYASDQ